MKLSSRLLRVLLLISSTHFAFGAGSTSYGQVEDSLPLSRHTHIAERYGNLPLSFERNQGQGDAEAKFLSLGDGYDISLTSTGALFTLDANTCSHSVGVGAPRHSVETTRHCVPALNSVLRIGLSGSNRNANVQGEDELPGKSNYFPGKNPSSWHTNITNFRKVRYQSVYPGIDLVYYGNQRLLEHDFIVAPGADPGTIRQNFTGFRKVSIDKAGNLTLTTEMGALQLLRPRVYQETGGVRQWIAGRYARARSGEIRYAIGVYDKSKELVIDPVLLYSTYLGAGANNRNFRTLAVDAEGDAYTAVGSTKGTVVSKLNPSGSAVLYSTVIGSTIPGGIAIDGQGNAYLTGQVNGEIPLVNAFQPTNPTINYCSFVTKLDASGSKLVYSTYFCGFSTVSNAIAADDQGSAYITGFSYQGLPVTRSLSKYTTGAFVTKFSPSGESLDYSTYLAGSGSQPFDSANGIAVDPAGEAIVTGETGSMDFPLANALYSRCASRPYSACDDTFVTKINASGTALVYSTYLGAGSGTAVTTNSEGDAFVIGTATAPSNFPAVHGFKSHTSNFASAYLTRLNAGGSALVYSTFLSDAATFEAAAIAVDAASDVYIAGFAGPGLETVNALQPIYAGQAADGNVDAFVMKINASASAVAYSTYLGGISSDYATAIGADDAGNAYVLGDTLSTNFPMKDPLPTPVNVLQTFLAKISEGDRSLFSVTNTVDPPVVGPGGELHYTITITNHGPAASAVLKDQSVRESLEVCKVSNGDPCTFSNHYFDATANLSPFANGESRTISITAKASPTAGDYNRIANAAQVSSGFPEYEDDSASAPVIVRDTADVGISSSVAVSPEGLLQYTHTITNLGPDAAHAVLLIDDLPANTTFASASTTAGECTFYPNLGAHGAVRCPLNNPNAGTPVQVQVVLEASRAACPGVRNTTSITSLSIDPNSANDQSTVVTNLPASICAP